MWQSWGKERIVSLGGICLGAVLDLVPKLAVALVKSSPVDLTLRFMLCLRENDGTRFVIC